MAASKIENAPWVRLGDLITQRREKNNYSDLPIRGVTREGFIPPKQEDADISLYNVFYKNDFVFNPARMELNSIALNTDLEKGICSSLYEIFYVTDTKKLDPRYLNLFIKRNEFARYCRYDSIGSARNYFRVANMQEIKIPLPSIETQKELVAVYNGLKELAEENEKLLEPLSKSCEAFIVDCKKKYPKKRLDDLITIDEKINSENQDLEFLGINRDKSFMPSVATTEGLDKSKYKVISKGKFVFSGMQTGRDVCIRFGLYNETVDGLVSPAYTTYSVVDKNILPEYLMMNFKRSEMDRLGWFLSDSSVRSNLDFDRFHDIQIPIPPIQIQQKIVDLYNCYEECKRIANEAREKISNLCPALIQKAAHTY